MNHNNIEIKTTTDGSFTIFLPEINEHYHSINGAIQESMHVFINAGLKQHQSNYLNILEIGFGTGLNAFLTLLNNISTLKSINYYGIERYPLALETIQNINYGKLCDNEELFLKLHKCNWEEPIPITSNFILHKIETDANKYHFNDPIDLVYFDAFAPEKQPEMWNIDLFYKLYQCMCSEGILTTYCAKGSIRRMMQEVGFIVERIPGPAGKREMLRAKKA